MSVAQSLNARLSWEPWLLREVKVCEGKCVQHLTHSLTWYLQAGMIELDEEDEAAVRQMLLQRRKAVKRLSDDDAASAANTQAALRGVQEMADLPHKGANGASAQVRCTSCGAGRVESGCIL